jgi:hypothetical protein
MKKEKVTKHSTESLVNHLTEIKKEIQSLFDLCTEDEYLDGKDVDIHDMLDIIEDFEYGLKRAKNINIKKC